ncbi:MAG TPA: metal ABC transporter permease, partial [Bacteroidales bacterium]|nr:metal ABC transporter permease [Bacteroidales bacterium]
MENLFEYSFVLRSLLGALFASITAGVAGTYIVSRRLV